MRIYSFYKWSFLLLALVVMIPEGTLTKVAKGNFNGITDQLGSAVSKATAKVQQGGFDSCLDLFPNRIPVATINEKTKHIDLCSNNFAVLYSPVTKTPLVVVEKLNKALLKDAQGEERTDQFFADARIPPESRAELSDYKGSGFDRGHMSPAADQPDQAAMTQSFALSNMVPQDPVNNRKIWSKIESDVRKFAQRANGNVYVFTGPLFEQTHREIGINKVWVPSRLYKLVYDESSKRAWAYVLPNAETKITPPVDYDTFVKLTRWNFLQNLPVSGSVSQK